MPIGQATISAFLRSEELKPGSRPDNYRELSEALSTWCVDTNSEIFHLSLFDKCRFNLYLMQ